MATLFTNVQELYSDICDEIRLFFPVKRIDFSADRIDSDFSLQLYFYEENTTWTCVCSLFLHATKQNEKIYTDEIDPLVRKDALYYKKLKKRFIKNSLYRYLREYTGLSQPWGSLTGIRPTKLVRELYRETDDPYRFLKDNFDVSDEKISLLRVLEKNQKPYVSVDDKAVDIYIGIPFCKSRCSYCSFISQEYDRNTALKDKYLECLFREMKAFSDIYDRYSVRCIYIGGGTPTALDEAEFGQLLARVDECFPEREEYTVEAGRCDTLSEDKFISMKDHGVTRISINPQTTCDRTLKIIGRDYKNRLFFRVFDTARKMGFDNINSDLIFGLPGENAKVMLKSLKDVMKLRPENITVHTLAIKNSSFIADRYMQSGNSRKHRDSDDVRYAVEQSFEMLVDGGYDPYYMYRQKYMSGNLENVGYSLPGKICRYNIDNMEETTNVLALGSGGISKRIFACENRIERSSNVKDITNYCNRTDEMTERNRDLFR